jgi:hypothetical protein
MSTDKTKESKDDAIVIKLSGNSITIDIDSGEILDDDIYECAGCEGQYIYGDESECHQCDNLFCPECEDDNRTTYVDAEGDVQYICQLCIDDANWLNREYRGRWSNE